MEPESVASSSTAAMFLPREQHRSHIDGVTEGFFLCSGYDQNFKIVPRAQKILFLNISIISCSSFGNGMAPAMKVPTPSCCWALVCSDTGEDRNMDGVCGCVRQNLWCTQVDEHRLRGCI